MTSGDEPTPQPRKQKPLPHNLKYLLDEGFYVGHCKCNNPKCGFEWIGVLDKKDQNQVNKIRCNECGGFNNQWKRIRKKDFIK